MANTEKTFATWTRLPRRLPNPEQMIKATLLTLFLSAAACAAPMVAITAQADAGDLYEADFASGTIFKFTPEGVKSTFASGLTDLVGLAFDRQGNLFAADSGTGTIFEFNSSGAQSVFASGLSGPTGLAFDGLGDLLVADFGSGTIFKFTPDGTKSVFASGLHNPTGLVFDRSGNLFAADFGNGAILKITGVGTTSIFASGLTNPGGLAFDRAGNLFAADIGGGTIFEFTPAGTRNTFASGLSGPAGLAFDAAGNLFVADNTSGTIFKFTPDGIKSTYTSGLSQPTLIAFEPVTEKLQNISARAFVQSADNVLIAGFIVGGNTLFNNVVLVRAIGPSLASSGVTNPLQDPTLELHDASGATIASNNNWQDTQSAPIAASGLAPTDPSESAILATLAAGSYTAVARGANDTSGVALLEIYSVH